MLGLQGESSDRLFRKYAQILRECVPSFTYDQYDKSISLTDVQYLEKFMQWKTLFSINKIKIKLLEGREVELNESYRRHQKSNSVGAKNA